MGTRMLAGEARGAKPVAHSESAKSRSRRNGLRKKSAVIAGMPAGIPEYLRIQVERVFELDDPDTLITTMVAVGRQRARAEAGVFQTYVIRRLRQATEQAVTRRKVWLWTRLCSARPEIEAREVACALLDTFWRDHRKDVERLTLNLARDEEREVRLYAASTMARIIRSNFRAYFRYMRAWSRHSDPSVRRQVVIATVAVADSDHPEWARPLLDLLEPHLTDRDPYIRRNLGPFALGQGMLRVYPEETLARCEKWLGADNEIVRWNIGMAFTTPVLPVDWNRALSILRPLASDDRRFVWGAAAQALKNMVLRDPRRVRPVLRRWMEEPPLRVAVSTAFSTSVR